MGQGATGGVYKGRNKKSGELCAVKTFNEMGYMRPYQVQIREFDIIQKLKHRNIVKLIAIEEELSTRTKVIIMELCTGGSLLNLLDDPENAFGLPDSEFFVVLHDVADGMRYLRDQGFVHRDIKPGNIMRCISDDGRPVYKLTDFGAARQLEEGDQFMSLYGTEEYLCPDMYEKAVLQVPSHKRYDASVDLWSLGVTFYHAAAGQLPFRPFGGRKNRETMFYITTKKESGVISGVQHKEDGSIEWSRTLPKNCRLSVGATKLVTPLLAGLMEADPAKVWTHDRFFEEVLKVRRKMALHVFSFPTCALLSVYADKDASLAQVQALITEQTDLHANRQDLSVCQMPLTRVIDPMQNVKAYPETSPSTPIMLYTTSNAEFPKIPNVECPAFPQFSNNLALDIDAISAKSCCATLYLYFRLVRDFTLRKKLLTTAVWQYMLILSQDVDHVKYYVTLFERTCKESLQSLMYVRDTYQNTLNLAKLLQTKSSKLSTLKVLGGHIVPLEQDIRQIQLTLGDTKSKLETLNKRVIQRRNLITAWQEKHREDTDNVAKLEVILSTVKDIRKSFQRDKAKKRLSFNDEQIHKFDRMKIAELCTKALSLLDHCLHDLQQHFVKVQDWFNVVCPIRQQLSKMEHNVATLIERQDQWASNLSEAWRVHQEDLVSWLNSDHSESNRFMTDSPTEAIPAVVEGPSDHLLPFSSSVDPVGANSSSLTDLPYSNIPQVCADSGRDKEKAYKKELVSKLKDNLKSLGDETHYVRNAIQEGAELIKQFEEVLSIKSLDLDQNIMKSPRGIHDR